MQRSWTRLDLVKRGGATSPETEFTVLDIETTALAPPGRVIEIGAVRMRGDGHVVNEFSTLVHPGYGVDLGATWVHKIFPKHIEGAPSMREVVGDLLAFMGGSVLVAHNANFEERFLRHEFGLLGVPVQGQYSLCTLELSQTYFPQLPNHRLLTVAESFRLPSRPDHSALEDARVCAQLLATFLDHPYSFALSATPRIETLPSRPAALRPLQPRVSGLRKGEEGWLASLMHRLPMSAPGTTHPDVAQRYAELLSDALADGRIIGDEAKQLARFASQSGMSQADVQSIHRSMLDGMRGIAEADGVIDDQERQQLVQTAKLLGFSDYFDNLPKPSAVSRPPSEDPRSTRPRSPGSALREPWDNRRVLFLTAGERTVLLQELLIERGARIAKILTETVTHIVAEPSSKDPRIERAQQRNLPVLTLAELQSWFLETVPTTQTTAPPAEPAQQPPPAEKQSKPAAKPPLPVGIVSPTEHISAAVSPPYPIANVQAAWHYPQPAPQPPAETPARASRRVWVWSVLAVFPLLFGGFCCLGGFGALLNHDIAAGVVGITLGILLVAAAFFLGFLAVRNGQGKARPSRRP